MLDLDLDLIRHQSQIWLSPLVPKAASFQVAVLQLASCRGDKRLARVLIVPWNINTCATSSVWAKGQSTV
jgi:hypothetical protein